MKEGESDWIGVFKLKLALAVIQKERETVVAQVGSPPWSVEVRASPEGDVASESRDLIWNRNINTEYGVNNKYNK